MRKIFNICFVLVLISIGSICYGLEPSSNEIYNGIDVSAWQGSIDYKRVKASGIDVVYMKTSQGNDYIDPYFKINYTNAKMNGLKVGFYHFVTATNVDDAINEARFFADVISGTSPDCKLAMDFETLNYLSYDEINSISVAFLNEVVNITGKEAVIYSDASNTIHKFGEELAEKYPLWIAEYGVEEPINNGKWNSWVGFQYTSDGEIGGISGRVDMDKFTNGIFLSENNIEPVQKHNKSFQSDVKNYIVEPGNTLWGISIEYGTTVEDIATLNNIINPNLIFPGEKLIIPVSTNDIKISKYSIYTIRWGDTLTGISEKYNIPIRTLIKLNGIANPNLIYAGSKIKV